MTDEAKALVERLEEWALTLLAACEGGDLVTDEPAALMYQARDRIEQLEREKAVVSDLWEQQKEIALDYLADCNKAADLIETQAREIERLREELAAAYVHQSGTNQHASDCATSNAPAMKPGPCDCAALGEKQ